MLQLECTVLVQVYITIFFSTSSLVLVVLSCAMSCVENVNKTLHANIHKSTIHKSTMYFNKSQNTCKVKTGVKTDFY